MMDHITDEQAVDWLREQMQALRELDGTTDESDPCACGKWELSGYRAILCADSPILHARDVCRDPAEDDS